MMTTKRCAWCEPLEPGEVLPEGVSHGMCPSCEAELMGAMEQEPEAQPAAAGTEA